MEKKIGMWIGIGNISTVLDFKFSDDKLTYSTKSISDRFHCHNNNEKKT